MASAIVDTTATGLPTDILKVAGMAVIMLKKHESYRRLFIRCLVPTPFTHAIPAWYAG